jgi:hypothetical protein
MKITINTKDYEFKFAMKALRNLEKRTGKKTSEIVENFSNISESGVDFDLMAIILHEGLIANLPELTIEECENILDNGGGGDLVSIMNAFSTEVSGYWTKNLPNAQSPTT